MCFMFFFFSFLSWAALHYLIRILFVIRFAFIKKLLFLWFWLLHVGILWSDNIWLTVQPYHLFLKLNLCCNVLINGTGSDLMLSCVFSFVMLVLLTACYWGQRQHALAEPWWTTHTRIRHTQQPLGRRTGGQPASYDRRSLRSHRIHRAAYSGPLLTSQRTSSAALWRASCHLHRRTRRKACTWSRGCDPVWHLWDNNRVVYLSAQ